MAKTAVGPFTDADYNRINDFLSRCDKVKLDVERAITAKQPADGYLTLLQAICDEFRAIKRAFWPDRP